jgi:hypothetical protein
MLRYLLKRLLIKVNQELQKLRRQQLVPPSFVPAGSVSSDPLPTEIKQSDTLSDGNQELELKKRIQDLEQEKSNLEKDLKMTVIRQREAGASTNEIVRQLESEISK